MVKTILLIAAFSVRGGTVTNVTVLPDMKTCQFAKEQLYKFKQHKIEGWTSIEQYEVRPPVKAECKEN